MARFKHGSLVFNKNTEQLNSNKTLSYNSAQLQFLEPIGSNKIVYLSQEADSIGLAFWIINRSSFYTLNVYNDTGDTLIADVRPLDVVCFLCDGSVWEGDIEYDGATGGTGATGSTGAAGANGTGSRSITTKTSNYDMTDDDDIILVDCTSGNVQVKLPNPVGATIKNRDIKKIDSSSNTVSIIPYSAENVDGTSSKVLNVQYANMTLTTNNTNWYIL
jgi:hypothetical protein